MSNTVVMKAPSGFSGSASMNQSTPPSTGQNYTPNAQGFVLVDPIDVAAMQRIGFTVVGPKQAVAEATAMGGTTATLGVGSVGAAAPADLVVATTTGGTTPSLTLPLAADLAAALPMMQIGDTYVLRVINTNSGTATIVTNTGWTLSGTLTLATNTWREFLVTKTAAATFSAKSIGVGTMS